MEPDLQITTQSNNKKVALYVVVFLVLATVIGYSVYRFISYRNTPKSPVDSAVLKANQHTDMVLASLIGNSPKPLQDYFLNSVGSGQFDKYAKSAAYFIMHRYFDNKGNIYEIYDYSNSDSRLAFLKEAENIYPDIFAKIKNNTLPKTFSEEGTYAYLAYLEALDKKGYADVAAQGTAAGQYAKMAYIGKMMSSDKNVKNLSQDQKRNLNKAILFASNANKEVATILDSKTIPDSEYVADIVIGLNQYAYALRYFGYFQIPFESSKNPEEIFAFTTDYTNKYVPVLRMFTHLVDASSLSISNATDYSINKALQPIVAYDLSVPPRDYSVIDRIIKARLGNEKEGIYSKENISTLANKSPDFKAWLIKAGWVAADFK